MHKILLNVSKFSKTILLLRRTLRGKELLQFQPTAPELYINKLVKRMVKLLGPGGGQKPRIIYLARNCLPRHEKKICPKLVEKKDVVSVVLEFKYILLLVIKYLKTFV